MPRDIRSFSSLHCVGIKGIPWFFVLPSSCAFQKKMSPRSLKIEQFHLILTCLLCCVSSHLRVSWILKNQSLDCEADAPTQAVGVSSKPRRTNNAEPTIIEQGQQILIWVPAMERATDVHAVAFVRPLNPQFIHRRRRTRSIADGKFIRFSRSWKPSSPPGRSRRFLRSDVVRLRGCGVQPGRGNIECHRLLCIIRGLGRGKRCLACSGSAG